MAILKFSPQKNLLLQNIPESLDGKPRRFIFIMILVFLFPAISGAKESIQLYEQEIKAGLLYNFLKYTNWPQTSMGQDNKINLCIYGDDPFEGYLKPMQGRSVNQRIIKISNIHSFSDVANCQMLFVNENSKAEWPELHNSLSGKSILTVSDINNFTKEGGMIEFAHQDSHIEVNFNENEAKNAKLSVQDRLLNLVTIVRGN